MARAHPHRFYRPHPHASDPNDIAAARRRGGPDPRTFERQRQEAAHAAARDRITDEVQDMNNLYPADHEAINTRVEVVERLPWFQEKLAQSRWFDRFVSPQYENHFSLLDYAYGRRPRGDRHLPRYVISRTLEGYVVPLPTANAVPETDPPRDPRLRGRHNDLVIGADGESSWAGTLSAWADPATAHIYEHAVGVGPDIDVLGLGNNSDRVIDEMGRITPGNVTVRRTAMLTEIAENLEALQNGALMNPGPPRPPQYP